MLPAMRLDAMFPYLPPGFAIHVIGSFLACMSVFLLSKFFAPLLVTKFNSFDANQKYLWHATAVSLYATATVSYFALGEVPRWIEYFAEAGFGPYKDLFVMETSIELAYVCGISVGYMSFDTFLMLVHPRASQALGKWYYWQMMFHHVVSIYTWTYCITWHRCVVYVFFLVCTEFTSIFMNTVFLLEYVDAHAKYQLIAGVAVMLSFVVVRLIPIPFVAWMFYAASYAEWDVYSMVLCACTVPWPHVLNLYWFSIMVSKALQRIGGATEEKKKKKK